jgi:hypothetical protein
MEPVAVNACVSELVAEKDALLFFSMEFLPDPDVERRAESLAELPELAVLANPPPPRVRYWLNRASPTGCDARTLCSAESPGPLAADDAFLYWAERREGTVVRLPRAGGEPTTIARDLGYPHAVVPARDAIYVGALGGPNANGVPASLVRIDKETLAATVLSHESAEFLAADESHVYWASDDCIRRVPKTGGRAALVTRSAARIRSLAVLDDHAYFLGGTLVQRVRTSGGVAETIADEPSYALAVDQTGLYWGRRTKDDGGAIGCWPHAGPARTIGLENRREPRYLALSPTHVYAMTNGGMFACAKPPWARQAPAQR